MLIEIDNENGRELLDQLKCQGVAARDVTEQNQQLAKDATRYQWLRNESWAGYNASKKKPQVFKTVTMILDGAHGFKTILAEEALDKAVDTAIKSQGDGV